MLKKLFLQDKVPAQATDLSAQPMRPFGPVQAGGELHRDQKGLLVPVIQKQILGTSTQVGVSLLVGERELKVNLFVLS